MYGAERNDDASKGPLTNPNMAEFGQLPDAVRRSNIVTAYATVNFLRVTHKDVHDFSSLTGRIEDFSSSLTERLEFFCDKEGAAFTQAYFSAERGADKAITPAYLAAHSVLVNPTLHALGAHVHEHFITGKLVVGDTSRNDLVPYHDLSLDTRAWDIMPALDVMKQVQKYVAAHKTL